MEVEFIQMNRRPNMEAAEAFNKKEMPKVRIRAVSKRRI